LLQEQKGLHQKGEADHNASYLVLWIG
jgi:hypothetical protein